MNEINEKYCFKGEDGQYSVIKNSQQVFNLKDDCNTEAFTDEINALMTNECDIKPFIMPVGTLNTMPNFNIEGYSSNMIDFMMP